MIKKIVIIFLIVLVVVFLSNCVFSKIRELNAEVITATTIIVAAAVLIVAGFIFYEYDDMVSAAQNIYANDIQFQYDVDDIVNQMSEVSTNDAHITNTMLDNIYNFYDEHIANNEWVSNALYNLKSSIVNNYSFVEDENGNYMFLNVVPGGGYYSSVSEFPIYDDLIHKKIGVQFTSTGFSTTLSPMYVGSDDWAWKFTYLNDEYYLTITTYAPAVNYFGASTGKTINDVLYNLKKGNSAQNWRFDNRIAMAVAVMAITEMARPYIVSKLNSGATTYVELWTPVSADNDYVIDEPTNERINTGAAWPIEVQYGLSGGLNDRSKNGADVLSGAAADVAVPIDTPSDMLGTDSAHAIDSDWTGTTDYTHTQEATAAAEATWSEYTGEMQEMDIPEVIISKFPFCIPFDLAHAIGNLVATPEAPKFTYVLNAGMIQNVDFEIDFSKFDWLATIIRWGVLILFNIALIKLTRNIIRG